MTAKRALDIAFGGLGLIVSAPLWLIIAAALKLYDGGPVFYGQPRVGWHGRIFHVWKFRSMRPDAERETGPLQATANDPRVTPVGRVLRATAMDELPQLWNIFNGDMSVVGPRALRPGEIEAGSDGEVVAAQAVAGFAERCSVRPGLTGLAQLYAPRDVSRRSKFRYDRLYVRRQSFALDLRLIAVSFWISLRGSWEHRGRKF
jgi:lipopolysaccharide/colanic/teichoic acid biosynthesis glycosyltransferase